MLLEGVDVVDVQQRQTLVAEEDLVLDDGSAAEVRGVRAGVEWFLGQGVEPCFVGGEALRGFGD